MVVISFEENKNIKKLSVSGHANFDEFNKDIVCAGISAITFGFCEYLRVNKEKNIEYKILENKNKIIFYLNKNTNKICDKIFNILYIQLKLVYINYKKNIKWIENNE